MPDTTFETLLSGQLRAYAEAGVRPVDRFVVAEEAIAAGRTRLHRGLGLGSLRGNRALVPLLVGLLLAALAGGALLAGSRLLSLTPARHVYLDELVSAPDLPTPMGAPTLVPLLDGRVLVMSNNSLPNTALLHDPATGVSVPAGPWASPDQQVGSAIRLKDGRVFVTGDGVSEIFDPTTLEFASVGPMATARSFPELALLPDGRVLVAGGVQPGGSTLLRSAELFDPSTRSFSPTGSMQYDGGPMGMLPDGRVFVASSPNAEIYDPSSGRFSYAGVVLPGGVTGATSLADGRIAIIGVTSVTGPQSGGFVGVWDPADHTYQEVWGGSQSHPLWSATTLDDGRVLVVGGRGAPWAGALDPATGQMKPVGAPAWSRPTVTRLPDGRVLLVGGLDTDAGSTIQVFQ